MSGADNGGSGNEWLVWFVGEELRVRKAKNSQE